MQVTFLSRAGFSDPQLWQQQLQLPLVTFWHAGSSASAKWPAFVATHLEFVILYLSPWLNHLNSADCLISAVLCKWYLSLKGWAGICQQWQTLTRSGTSKSISDWASCRGVGMCLEGTSVHRSPCDPSGIQGLPCSTTLQPFTVHISHSDGIFFFDLFKESLNTPNYATEFKSFSEVYRARSGPAKHFPRTWKWRKYAQTEG